MIVAALKETLDGERRVSLVPAGVAEVQKLSAEVWIERGAGMASGYPDEEYEAKGAKIVDRAQIIDNADIVLAVRWAAANPGAADRLSKKGQAAIGFMEPYQPDPSFSHMRDAGVTSFAMERMPRITRAQAMDALSSMANLAGYKSALIAADNLPKMFPMMMTAAGTIVPAKVFVVGVGVAGLQAIATTKRLGAVVSAYDVRPAVKEQVESLGAKFVEIELDTGDSEDKGGYARAMDEEFYTKQREMMKQVVADSDVVITTAAIPGKPSPVLVTEEMVQGMRPGSLIVDLAVERGGNCELSEMGTTVQKHNVTIVGPINLPSSVPFNASQLYSKNITSFLATVVTDGAVSVDMDDEIIAATVVTHNGEVPNDDLRAQLEL